MVTFPAMKNDEKLADILCLTLLECNTKGRGWRCDKMSQAEGRQHPDYNREVWVAENRCRGMNQVKGNIF